MKLLAFSLAVVILAMTALVLAQGYAGRVALRDSQLAACERAKLDRRVNAEGWRVAEHARRASGTATDLRAADLYDRIATGLEMRARVVCARAYPPVRLLGK